MGHRLAMDASNNHTRKPAKWGINRDSLDVRMAAVRRLTHLV